MHPDDILLVGGDMAFMEEFGRVAGIPHLRHVPEDTTEQHSFSGFSPHIILYRPHRSVPNPYALCAHIKTCRGTAGVPVVILSDVSDPEDKLKAFSAGAIDYLVAPFIPIELQTRIRSILNLQQNRRDLEQQCAAFNAKVRELAQGKIIFLRGMASLAETRDPETGDHLVRVQHYMKILCRHLRAPRAQAGHKFLSVARTADICRAAILHDIGKVGVPDHILLKEGPLTSEEFGAMKLHTLYGENIIKKLRRGRQEGDLFLHYAQEITGGHHEYWNGGGYPRGLSGEAIPLSARLMAVADVYDSIISPRVYKPAHSHTYAFEFIMDNSGIRFDPAIVEAFFCQHKHFNRIANRFVTSPA